MSRRRRRRHHHQQQHRRYIILALTSIHPEEDGIFLRQASKTFKLIGHTRASTIAPTLIFLLSLFFLFDLLFRKKLKKRLKYENNLF